MTDESETYELKAVLKVLRAATRAAKDRRPTPFLISNEATARAILTALKLAQARAEKREQKRYDMRFIEWVSSIEADGPTRPPPINPIVGL